jgi:hypothetical protein
MVLVVLLLLLVVVVIGNPSAIDQQLKANNSNGNSEMLLEARSRFLPPIKLVVMAMALWSRQCREMKIL